MHIYRTAIDDFIVFADIDYPEVTSKLAKAEIGILFVVEKDLTLVGTITQGDILTKKLTQSNLARDICNRQPVVAEAILTDNALSRFISPRIQCIPLVDSERRLVEIARVLKVTEKVNLNVGAGGTSIPAFVNLDVESDWYKEHNRGLDYVAYDIRQDELPYKASTVDNIYCSHVIEHIENNAVENFLNNCFRVLKESGVLRIACPDAEFLYNVSRFDNDFWFWRRDWFIKHCAGKALHELSQSDFLVREVATPRVGHKLKHAIEYRPETMETDLLALTQGLVFDIDNIGNHINYWTFEKLKKMAIKVGFIHVVESKYQGCVSQDMVGEYFDKTRPGMSLYVDLVK